MNNNLIIYSVKSKYHTTEEIHAFFDNQEAAEEFVNRFKVTPELKIAIHFLNPEHKGNKSLRAYCVVLHKIGKQSYDLDFYELICTALMAKKEEYTLEFQRSGTRERNTFQLTLFAECKAEAIKEAMVMRDAIVKSGHWELAFLKVKPNGIHR